MYVCMYVFFGFTKKVQVHREPFDSPYIHTYIQTYIHTYTYTYIHTHLHCTQVDADPFDSQSAKDTIHTYTYTYTYTYIHTCTAHKSTQTHSTANQPNNSNGTRLRSTKSRYSGPLQDKSNKSEIARPFATHALLRLVLDLCFLFHGVRVVFRVLPRRVLCVLREGLSLV